MGQKMSNAPIFYTLAQIRFSPVLGMAKFVSEIQDQLRVEFPDFRTEQRRTLQLTDAAEAADLKSASLTRWHFVDQSGTSGYILESSSLIFHTTAYETSSWFFDKVLLGMNVVHTCASLSYIERLGFRTLDGIVPENGSPLELYLNPEALGFYKSFAGDLKQHIAEAAFAIPPAGNLIVRSVVMKGLLGVPADVFPISLTLAPRMQNLEGNHAVLDIDRSEDGKMPVNIAVIRERFEIIKKDATDAFKRLVTPEALSRWQ
jgi:uncharacterized protein (TIGR04255 family)